MAWRSTANSTAEVGSVGFPFCIIEYLQSATVADAMYRLRRTSVNKYLSSSTESMIKCAMRSQVVTRRSKSSASANSR